MFERVGNYSFFEKKSQHSGVPLDFLKFPKQLFSRACQADCFLQKLFTSAHFGFPILIRAKIEILLYEEIKTLTEQKGWLLYL